MPLLFESEKECKNGFQYFRRSDKYDFHHITSNACYLQNRIRNPATISRTDCIQIKNESGRKIERSIPRPAASRPIPIKNDSFFMFTAPFYVLNTLYAEMRVLTAIFVCCMNFEQTCTKK